MTPSGVFSAGSTVRGHCQTQKSMCYTCTKAMHGNLAAHNIPDGGECVFPWSSTGDETQLTETTCADIGHNNYPLGWCTADLDGVYDTSATSSFGQCAPGRCVAVQVDTCLTCPPNYTSPALSTSPDQCFYDCPAGGYAGTEDVTTVVTNPLGVRGTVTTVTSFSTYSGSTPMAFVGTDSDFIYHRKAPVGFTRQKFRRILNTR